MLSDKFVRKMDAKHPIIRAKLPVEGLTRDAERRGPNVRRRQLAHSQRATPRTAGKTSRQEAEVSPMIGYFEFSQVIYPSR
jgi:hypothetical protein